MKWFITNLSNKHKKTLLRLLQYLAFGCVCIAMALASLILNGKHSPEIYVIGIYIDLGFLIADLIVSWLIEDSLLTMDDWAKQKELRKMDYDFKKLELEELKIKRQKGGEK